MRSTTPTCLLVFTRKFVRHPVQFVFGPTVYEISTMIFVPMTIAVRLAQIYDGSRGIRHSAKVQSGRGWSRNTKLIRDCGQGIQLDSLF